ncbi:hypothetical protein N7497_003796 [Penicillium chrysogenum]|nr:hypothetical protein N7497_003796 [Penicillium chrysogenum]
MTFSIFLLLASVHIRAAFCGTITIIDYDRQCVIWSDRNYGCTGHSEPFALLDGDDCSDLSKVTYGIRKDHSKVDVGVCGTGCWQLVYCSCSAFNVFISIVCFRLVFVGAISILHF